MKQSRYSLNMAYGSIARAWETVFVLLMESNRWTERERTNRNETERSTNTSLKTHGRTRDRTEIWYGTNERTCLVAWLTFCLITIFESSFFWVFEDFDTLAEDILIFARSLQCTKIYTRIYWISIDRRIGQALSVCGNENNPLSLRAILKKLCTHAFYNCTQYISRYEPYRSDISYSGQTNYRPIMVICQDIVTKLTTL